MEQATSEYIVRTNETDSRGRVRSDALLNYMQEAASRHAVTLGFGYDDMRIHKTFWVLSRISAHFSAFPELGHTISLITWPSGIKGPYAYRNFILACDGLEFCSATSAWLILDEDSKRPHRPERFLLGKKLESMARIASPEAINNLVKLPGSDGALISAFSPVVYTDLDINNHVNNVKLIERGINAVPASMWESSDLTRIEANFLAEATSEDELAVRTNGAISQTSISADIVKKDGNETACKMRITWEG